MCIYFKFVYINLKVNYMGTFWLTGRQYIFNTNTYIYIHTLSVYIVCSKSLGNDHLYLCTEKYVMNCCNSTVIY